MSSICSGSQECHQQVCEAEARLLVRPRHDEDHCRLLRRRGKPGEVGLKDRYDQYSSEHRVVRRFAPIRVSAAVAVLMMVVGCTAPDREGSEPSTEPGPSVRGTVRPSPSPSPTESAAPDLDPGWETSAGEFALVDAPVEWFTSAGPSQELGTVHVVTAETMVVSVSDLSGDRVLSLGPGSRVELLVPSGQIVQDAYLVGDEVVVTTAAAHTEGFWVTRWDPATGATRTVFEATGDDAWFSETAVAGADLFLTGRGDDDMQCVLRLDLNATDPERTPSAVACAEPGKDVRWLKVTDGSLTFLTGDDETPCPTMHRVRLPGGSPERLAVDGCVSRGIADANLIVWSQPPPVDDDESENYFAAELWAQVDGEVHDLGTAVTGSTAVCGGTLFWTWIDSEAPVEPSQIRRWTPGGSIEVVYRSPDGAGFDAYATSRAFCHGDVIFFQRFGWWGSAGQELMTNVPLAWVPDLDSAGAAPGS